jgi:hypothetical protein
MLVLRSGELMVCLHVGERGKAAEARCGCVTKCIEDAEATLGYMIMIHLGLVVLNPRDGVVVVSSDDGRGLLFTAKSRLQTRFQGQHGNRI